MQVMDNLSCMTSQVNAAPRAVIFLDEDSDVSQAFIVADEDVSIEIYYPSADKVLLGLVSIYYAWHQSFPPAYKQAMRFFSHKIFKVKINSNSGVGKFLRKL